MIVVESERDRPLAALRPGGRNTDAAPEGVSGDPAFMRLSKGFSAGRDRGFGVLSPGG